MTHRAAGSFRGVPRIWLIPVLVLALVLGMTAAGYLSRALLLDLIAWWPVWALLVVIVIAASGRRIGKLRISGLISILVSAVLVVFVIGHLNGWPLNPSASRYLVGPEPEPYRKAELSASVDGDLVLAGGSGFLYEVDPVPGGGDIGIPGAQERTVDSSISIVLEEPAHPGLATFAGWDVSVSSSPVWDLNLRGNLSIDVTGLHVADLMTAGGGSIVLGAPEQAPSVTVNGGFNIAVPLGVPVRVVGSAQVPSGWEELDDGWRSPVAGTGWTITVPEGSVVSIEER